MKDTPTFELRLVRPKKNSSSVAAIEQRWLVEDGEPYVATERRGEFDRMDGSSWGGRGEIRWQPVREEWRGLPEVVR